MVIFKITLSSRRETHHCPAKNVPKFYWLFFFKIVAIMVMVPLRYMTSTTVHTVVSHLTAC